MISSYEYLLTRTELYEKYEAAAQRSRILYISGCSGCGKTVSIADWLRQKNRSYSYVSADNEDFFKKLQDDTFRKSKLIVLDDIFVIDNEDTQAELIEYISKSSARFVLIGRSSSVSWLKPFILKKELSCFNEADLLFTRNETEELLKKENISISRLDIDALMTDTYGLPLMVMLASRYLQAEPYSQRLCFKVKADYFDCLDYTLYRKLGRTERSFIEKLSIMQSFSLDLAEQLTKCEDAEQYLLQLCRMGNTFIMTAPYEYEFVHADIRQYFFHKLKQHMQVNDVKKLYQRAGQYYELKGSILDALKYYDLADNTDKVCSLLIKNSRNHASNAQFLHTRKYYCSLSEAQISESPELMCAMSMMQSVFFQPEESERWYQKLKEFSKKTDKKDSHYKTACEKLFYLDIALPHRGSSNIIYLLKKAAIILPCNTYLIQDMSVTGNMPSLMNGGKDFCEWTKIDRLLYMSLRKPVELALGKNAIGLADTAIGESLFEKNTDLNFTEVLTYVNNGFAQSNTGGHIQMSFADIGILSRIYAAEGSLDTAYDLVEHFRSRLENDTSQTLLPNVKALLVHLSLYRGNTDLSDKWMKEDAPDENKEFFTLFRYCYLIKVHIYIIHKKYAQAISLLERLSIYFKSYGRTYEYIQTMILYSVILYRMNDGHWTEEFDKALKKCEEYHFTRVIADEGAAVLKLLKNIKYSGDQNYLKTLIALTKKQTILYPTYMESDNVIQVQLTDMEKNVLRLIVNGLTNENIAEVLSISLRTVKFHSSNIYTKLNVKNRAQAIVTASELKLV